MLTDDQFHDRQDAAEREQEAASDELLGEWLAAWAEPARVIPTPGWGEKRAVSKFVDVLQDELSGTNADELFASIASVLHECDQGRGGHAMARIKAQAIITTLGRQYVASHLAEQVEGARE